MFNDFERQTASAEKATLVLPSKRRVSARRTNPEIDGQFVPAEKALSDVPSTGASKPPKHSRKTGHRKRAEKAISALPVARAPESAGHQSASNGGAQEDGHLPSVEKTRSMILSPVQLIVALQKRRRFILKSQQRIDRSTEQYLASCAGYKPSKVKRNATDKESKQAKALFAEVSAVRKAVEKDGGLSNAAEKAIQKVPPSYPSWADIPVILASAQTREPWDKMRAQTEKQMQTLAKSLPIWAWADQIHGLGPLGIAIIIGEAGDLSNYPSKSHLWKRLGLAVIDGERQQKKTDAEKAVEHGYNPARRSTIYTLADSLFRAQWRKKDGAETGSPNGIYGEMYARRRASTADREGWTLAHQHADAVRYMSKKMLAHMRAAWIKPPSAARSPE